MRPASGSTSPRTPLASSTEEASLRLRDYESVPGELADLRKGPEMGSDQAFRVFSSDRHLALVFSESRPEHGTAAT